MRLVYVQSETGRMEARAVVRLLLREDVMAPVLFMDPVFYSSHPCASLEEQVRCVAKAAFSCLSCVYFALPRYAVAPMIFLGVYICLAEGSC